MKLDSSKWNRIWSSPYLPNYVVIYLWYILSPILGRKRNGCLGRELRSGIVLLEPSKVLFVLQHWSLQGEISSLCLARNSFSLDSEVFALVHNWQRRPVSSLSAAKNLFVFVHHKVVKTPTLIKLKFSWYKLRFIGTRQWLSVFGGTNTLMWHLSICSCTQKSVYRKERQTELHFSSWFQLSFTVTLTVRVIIRYEWGLKDKRANSDQIQLFALSTKVEQ